MALADGTRHGGCGNHSSTRCDEIMPTALDNGIRSPRKLLAAVVRKLVATSGIRREAGAA